MPQEPITVHLMVDEPSDGKRLDVVLALFLPDCSRNRAADLLRQGAIRVNGESKKPSHRVRAGDLIEGVLPAASPVDYHPESIPLHILHEDATLLVLNKAPGMVVHPAAGHTIGTVVNALLYHCKDLKGIGGELRPGIVHRLDKDTSGTMVVAKTETALNHLAAQFKSRAVEKKYLALVYRETRANQGNITLPIGRHPLHRKKMSVGARKSRFAETAWRVRERFKGATLLELSLKTGRTHQIRVHCAAIGHPIIGDSVYGWRKLKKAEVSTGLPLNAIRSAGRQMLHSWRLSLVHPETGQRMMFESPMPQDMKELIAELQGQKN